MSALELSPDTLEQGFVPSHRGILTAELIAEAVARDHGVSVEELLSRSRSTLCVDARRELYRRLKTELRWSANRIGRFVGRDHATVAHGLRPEPLPRTFPGKLTTVVHAATVLGVRYKGEFGPEPSGPGWDWLVVRRYDGQPGVRKVIHLGVATTTRDRLRRTQAEVLRADRMGR